jgi:phage tail sheath protein FI
MAYKHGALGEITESKVQAATQADVVAAYIGTAPVNLIRGYADADLINMPIKISNMSEAQSKLGYAGDWDKFTLCEAFAEHFDNTVGNVGPIYVINVLDPTACKAETKTTKELTFANQRAEFESDDIILDTFAIEDMAEGVDYTLSYNFTKGTVVVQLAAEPKTAKISVSYNTVDPSKVDESDIIGQTTENGEYTGLSALKLLYQYQNVVLNILAAPGWSHIPAVYRAMVSIVQKLNGHWDGFVNADIPLTDGDAEINTIEKAIKWQQEKGYTSEYSKVYWPKVTDGSGRVFHLSTVGTATMQRVDLSHDAVPFESPSNKEIMATGQFFGENSKNRGFDQQTGNSLNEKGITTAVFWGGQWVLWGPHTAAYTYNGSMDARSIFDVNIRMLMYITNRFQQDHGTEIDQPITPQDKETILNTEKEKLDTLSGIGALIGTPTVEFVETANPTSSMMNGDFVWDFTVTNTPPMKSATARVCYTDEGFQSFFESE